MEIKTDIETIREFAHGRPDGEATTWMTGLERVKDEDLRSARGELVAARMVIRKRFEALGDDKFSTPEGSQMFADIGYYNQAIQKVEAEMMVRGLTL